MKTVAALLLASLLPAVAFDSSIVAENKTRPNAFAGVPWGAVPEDALRILNARSGVIVPTELPADQTRIELTGGTFSGQPAERWTLEFSGRKFFAATVTLRSAGTAPTLYRDLKQSLVTKYGPAAREGKPPLALGPDQKARRTQQRLYPDQKLFGNSAAWKFNTTLADKEPKTIELTLATPAGILATDESQLVVTMRYINDAIARTAEPGKSAPPAKTTGPDDL